MIESISKNSVWRGRFFRYAPLVLSVGVIFMASSTGASLSKTSRFIRPALEFLFPSASEETLYIYQVVVRKFAHFAEYSALAFFASRAFWGSRMNSLRDNWQIFALTFVLLVATIDEINQSLNPTRTGLFSDVLLDGLSGAVAIGILSLYKKIRSN